jgi:predicted transcriptional regulator
MPKKLDIAEQLRRAIIESKMSYADLFLATGINQSVISRFVAGERDLRLSTAAKLCEYLQLHLTPRN